MVWILFAAPSTHTAEDHSGFPILSFPHTNICYPLLQALVNFLNYTYIAVNSSPKADAISPMTTVSDIFHVLIINIEWFKSLLTLAIFHLLTGCSMLYFLNFLAFESSVYTRLPDPSYCFCLFSFSFLTSDPFLSHLAIKEFYSFSFRSAIVPYHSFLLSNRTRTSTDQWFSRFPLPDVTSQWDENHTFRFI